MTTLREHLIGFVDLLRARGVRISIAETIDALKAVAVAGFERAAMREALAASLIKDEADRAVFDEAFGAFFATPGRGAGESREGGYERMEGRGRGGESSAVTRPEADSNPRRPAFVRSARSKITKLRRATNASRAKRRKRMAAKPIGMMAPIPAIARRANRSGMHRAAIHRAKASLKARESTRSGTGDCGRRSASRSRNTPTSITTSRARRSSRWCGGFACGWAGGSGWRGAADSTFGER